MKNAFYAGFLLLPMLAFTANDSFAKAPRQPRQIIVAPPPANNPARPVGVIYPPSTIPVPVYLPPKPVPTFAR